MTLRVYTSYLNNMLRHVEGFKPLQLGERSHLSDIIKTAKDLEDIAFIDQLLGYGEDEFIFFKSYAFLYEPLPINTVERLRKSGKSDELIESTISNMGDLINEDVVIDINEVLDNTDSDLFTSPLSIIDSFIQSQESRGIIHMIETEEDEEEDISILDREEEDIDEDVFSMDSEEEEDEEDYIFDLESEDENEFNMDSEDEEADEEFIMDSEDDDSEEDDFIMDSEDEEDDEEFIMDSEDEDEEFDMDSEEDEIEEFDMDSDEEDIEEFDMDSEEDEIEEFDMDSDEEDSDEEDIEEFDMDSDEEDIEEFDLDFDEEDTDEFDMDSDEEDEEEFDLDSDEEGIDEFDMESDEEDEEEFELDFDEDEIDEFDLDSEEDDIDESLEDSENLPKSDVSAFFEEATKTDKPSPFSSMFSSNPDDIGELDLDKYKNKRKKPKKDGDVFESGDSELFSNSGSPTSANGGDISRQVPKKSGDSLLADGIVKAVDSTVNSIPLIGKGLKKLLTGMQVKEDNNINN